MLNVFVCSVEAVGLTLVKDSRAITSMFLQALPMKWSKTRSAWVPIKHDTDSISESILFVVGGVILPPVRGGGMRRDN